MKTMKRRADMMIRRLFAVIFLLSLIFFTAESIMFSDTGSGDGIYEDPDGDNSDPDTFDDPDVDFLPELDEFGNPIGQGDGGGWDLNELFDDLFDDGLAP
jgi:hypothetical protein